MQYHVDTPTQYIDQLEDDWRKTTLLKVRELLLDKELHLMEGIAYKMLSYAFKDQVVFHLNAQANYVSLYVGDVNKIEGSDELLQPFNLGKGCIRISRSINVDDTRLNEFIHRTLEVWKSGGETEC